MRSLLSLRYICQASMICLELLMHEIACALIFALLNAGSSIAARMAMIAITTSSSIRVNALICCFVVIRTINAGNYQHPKIHAGPSASRLTPFGGDGRNLLDHYGLINLKNCAPPALGHFVELMPSVSG